MLTNTFKSTLIAAALLSVGLQAQTHRMAPKQTGNHSVPAMTHRPAQAATARPAAPSTGMNRSHGAPLHQASHPAIVNRTHSSRITERHFRANLGREHQFRANRAAMASGFRYGGVTFRVAQVWPMGWSDSDQVYVGSSSGSYFLYNQSRPGEAVALDVDQCDTCGQTDQMETASTSSNDSVPTLTRGMSRNDVIAILGSPSNVVNRGMHQIWVYNNMSVIFVAGRVMDVR
jgi:hypothetical protein